MANYCCQWFWDTCACIGFHVLGVIEPNVSVWQEEGALCVERVVVFHIPQLLTPDYATLNIGCTGL